MSRRNITVFEHQAIRLNEKINGEIFCSATLAALQRHYGEKGVPYFSLIHKGVRFNEYVGVIQVGNILIEVLPKADKNSLSVNEEAKWRNILIDMMRSVGDFDINVTSSSNLRIKPNTVLDLYFELFIKEVEILCHKGLIKKYRPNKGNTLALKGSLLFSKQIQHNNTHHERFYVRHTTYDIEHQLHYILYKTICLLKQINTNNDLHSRLGVLMVSFPELPIISVNETTFKRLTFSRKTEGYKKAIEIAKLLLLHYHPDIINGQNNVLALMFDMNTLWEQFVFVSLRKRRSDNWCVKAQGTKLFWKPESGRYSKMQPDIILTKNDNSCVVLDTKWKNLGGSNPSPNDLRQMYVYHEYFNAKRVALIYPNSEDGEIKGTYMPTPTSNQMDKECAVISIAIPQKGDESRSIVKVWQENICTRIEEWVEDNTAKATRKN